MRKKLAIVSSYNTTCGNASYTHVLKEALSAHYDVDVVPINHKLMSNAHPAARARRRRFLAEMAAKLREYDCVNIQFEGALYGFSTEDACANVQILIRASRTLLFTIHRVQNPAQESPLWKQAIRNGTKVMRTLRAYAETRRNKAFGHFIDLLKDHKKNGHNVAVIVHTQREKEILELYYGLDDIVDFPLTFLSKEKIDAMLQNREAIRKKVFEKYSFDPNNKYIGVFGFLSENKGHHIAVEALNFLPPDYKLAIFGAQHPLSIREYDLTQANLKPRLFLHNNNGYISSLIELAEKVNSKDKETQTSPEKHRVRFLGSLSDPDFVDAMTAMDFIVVPYLETGQGGSGNASLALELECKTIFSRTFAFMELERYYPDCFEMTDIGNSSELAQKIYTWNKDVATAQKRATSVFSIENNALIHKEALEKGADAAQKMKVALMLSSTQRN